MSMIARDSAASRLSSASRRSTAGRSSGDPPPVPSGGPGSSSPCRNHRSRSARPALMPLVARRARGLVDRQRILGDLDLQVLGGSPVAASTRPTSRGIPAERAAKPRRSRRSRVSGSPASSQSPHRGRPCASTNSPTWPHQPGFLGHGQELARARCCRCPGRSSAPALPSRRPAHCRAIRAGRTRRSCCRESPGAGPTRWSARRVVASDMARSKNADAIAAVALRVVHREVGVLAAVRRCWRRAPATARCRSMARQQLMGIHLDRPAQASRACGGHHRRFGARRDIAEVHDEFIATLARQHAAVAAGPGLPPARRVSVLRTAAVRRVAPLQQSIAGTRGPACR